MLAEKTLTTEYIQRRLTSSYFLKSEVDALRKSKIDRFHLNCICKQRKDFILSMLKRGISIDEAILLITKYYSKPHAHPLDFVKIICAPPDNKGESNATNLR